ncbi:CPBP family intramembrane metalloprotease [Mycobacterium sp. CVI_P3]|uniref:CPBP family intramembrane metalloprotease n=1 Tax=Mycobacterium pinniadriaticum TaxID=2994102 RepID=A0ABT3S8T5_9MYCO|nr:CPBP family intramembrane glutamic endopeptidase [Mycobacterium pinniadriaticum]MCX2928816.1 CPBP family intramembrane metalloprotease [Mycobacterium pinniadriaticum]MCX2935317.1 CPBP family intramembrane metalloprotease [Mycobacterium pinniadriaticum]
MNRNSYRALALASGLVVYSLTAGLELPGRRHPVVQASLGTGLALATRAPLGLRPGGLRSGLRWGGAAAGAVAAGVAVTTAVPSVRTAMRDRELPASPVQWLAFEIPLGTVWSEEMAFRAALGTAAATAFGHRGGALLQAAAFGLSHIHDARASGEPVAGTVLVTGLAGWAFGWLAGRSGSVLAPVLAHLAINEAGAIAALVVQRRSG